MLQLDQAQTLALFETPESVADNKGMLSFSRRTEKEANDSRLMLVSYMILAIVLGSSGFMYWQTTSNESDVIVPEVQSIMPQSEELAVKSDDEIVTETDVATTPEQPSESVTEVIETDKPVLNVVEDEQAPDEETNSAPVLNTIVMHFKDDSWVEIFDASSERIAFGVKKAGYTMTVQGVAPFSVVLGRHQQVDVELDGQTVDLSSLPRNRSAKFKLPLSE